MASSRPAGLTLTDWSPKTRSPGGVRERIDSLDVLKARTVEAREALQKLLNDAKALQSKDAPATYLGLVESVANLCNSRTPQVGTFLDFVKWLQECDERGPSILFTYKIWGFDQARGAGPRRRPGP